MIILSQPPLKNTVNSCQKYYQFMSSVKNLFQALSMLLTAPFPNLELKEIFLSLGKLTVGKGFVAVKTPLDWGLQPKAHHHSKIFKFPIQNTIPWLAPAHGTIREKTKSAPERFKDLSQAFP